MAKRTTVVTRAGITGKYVCLPLQGDKVSPQVKKTMPLSWIHADIPPIAQVEIIRKGLDASVIGTLSEAVGLPAYKFAQTLNISPRTLVRRKNGSKPLDPSQSEKMLRVRRVLQEAINVVGRRDQQKAVAWLNREEVALGGVTPLSLLDTSAGEQAVMNVLGAIREGIIL
jgi:putative toxin-antitoxin system antitoxin component (TIGR02293 family)